MVYCGNLLILRNMYGSVKVINSKKEVKKWLKQSDLQI